MTAVVRSVAALGRRIKAGFISASMRQQRAFSAFPAVQQGHDDNSGRHCDYPNTTKPTISLKAYREKYNALEKGARLRDGEEEIVVGRVGAKREAGKKLVFFDVVGGNDEVADRLQVIASPGDDFEGEFQQAVRPLRRGDIVSVRGFAGSSQKGETSIIARDVELLAPCMSELPLPNSLLDKETRYRKRSLDLIVNSKTRAIFLQRAKVIDFIREYLKKRDFLEVETPILTTAAGGAAARPFQTKAWAYNDTELSMRIAPELFLKELIVGGYERVFEIGKQFRNEGVDSNHNPEFTTVEFYQAYANYRDLITMAEEIIRGAVNVVSDSPILSVYAKGGREVEIDFSQPFQKLDFLSSIEEKAGTKIPEVCISKEKDWRDFVKSLGVSEVEELPLGHLLDEAFSVLVEPGLIQPTFVLDHPRLLSPLARWKTGAPHLSERFEFYFAGMELINAYSELNDPAEQKLRFDEQAAERDAEGRGGKAAGVMEQSYCDSLQQGMPPTGGFGLGIDRLVMLITGQSQIRDVLLFPLMLNDLKEAGSGGDGGGENKDL